MHTLLKKCTCTRVCAPVQLCTSSTNFFAMETIANLSWVLSENRAGYCLPPALLLSRRNQLPDAGCSRNPSKSTLATTAVSDKREACPISSNVSCVFTEQTNLRAGYGPCCRCFMSGSCTDTCCFASRCFASYPLNTGQTRFVRAFSDIRSSSFGRTIYKWPCPSLNCVGSRCLITLTSRPHHHGKSPFSWQSHTPSVRRWQRFSRAENPGEPTLLERGTWIGGSSGKQAINFDSEPSAG